MTRIRFAALLALTFGFSAAAAAAEETYVIDGVHSQPSFSVQHMGFSMQQGSFTKVAGKVVLDRSAHKGNVDVTIDTTSIRTMSEKLDTHVKGEDFFNVAKYPTMTFKSSKVEKNADGSLKITGDLTIRGVTKSVALTATAPKPAIKDPWGLQRTAASASTKINRQDFGVAWNQKLDTGGMVVGDEITVTLDVEMVVPPAGK